MTKGAACESGRLRSRPIVPSLDIDMATEAQKKATDAYRKRNVKTFNVKFFPADMELYEWLQGKEGKNQYVKDLIRKDMESR